MKKYFGYIDEKGYLALKIYSTKDRYKELFDSNPPIFIPMFYAENSKEAKKIIVSTLIKSIEFNDWN